MKKLTFVLLASLLVTGSLWASEWGLIEPAAYPGVGVAGPAHASKLFVVSAPVVNGEAEVVLPLTNPRGALAVVLGDRPSRARANERALPRKEFVEPELETMDLPGEGVRFGLDALTPGEHRLRLQGLSKPLVQVAVAEPESPVELVLQVRPLAVRSGEEVVVSAELLDEAPVARAQVLATLANGTRLVLKDDGQTPDERAGDGVFTAAFVAPEVSGMTPLELQVKALGARAKGEPFMRVAPAAVMVTKPTSGIADEGVNVSPENLVVPLKPATGRFRVEVLYAAQGTTFAWAQEDVSLSGASAQVTLPRPQETWG
ncbi:MAG: choice-of-anchor X domain-containing protein, partial [Thermoanaerobaculum sp.]